MLKKLKANVRGEVEGEMELAQSVFRGNLIEHTSLSVCGIVDNDVNHAMDGKDVLDSGLDLRKWLVVVEVDWFHLV